MSEDGGEALGCSHSSWRGSHGGAGSCRPGPHPSPLLAWLRATRACGLGIRGREPARVALLIDPSSPSVLRDGSAMSSSLSLASPDGFRSTPAASALARTPALTTWGLRVASNTQYSWGCGFPLLPLSQRYTEADWIHALCRAAHSGPASRHSCRQQPQHRPSFPPPPATPRPLATQVCAVQSRQEGTFAAERPGQQCMRSEQALTCSRRRSWPALGSVQHWPLSLPPHRPHLSAGFLPSRSGRGGGVERALTSTCCALGNCS